MILSEYGWGGFTGNPFIIGTTDINEYYPVYSIGVDANYNQISEYIIDDIKSYQKIKNISARRTGFTRYDDLFQVLQSYHRPDVYQFTSNDENYYLTCSKGYIVDKDDNILLLLTSKEDFIFLPDGNLKNEVLKLFVSTELINNDIYKNVFKKINTEYIDYCYKNNIEVVFTTSHNIEERVFKNNFSPQYSNLEELNNILNSGEIGRNLFGTHQVQEEATMNNDSDYSTESTLINSQSELTDTQTEITTNSEDDGLPW